LGENTSHYLCSSLAAKGGFIGEHKGEQRESLSPGICFDPGNNENFINKHKDFGGKKHESS
jgi:hypothetical protein